MVTRTDPIGSRGVLPVNRFSVDGHHMWGALDTGQMVAIALGVVASACDLRNRRIPNLLTFGGAVAAIVFSLLAHGAPGLWISLGGWVVGVALFLPFWLLGGMGAGDVKLLACLGA